jgi:hypothetical protein
MLRPMHPHLAQPKRLCLQQHIHAPGAVFALVDKGLLWGSHVNILQIVRKGSFWIPVIITSISAHSYAFGAAGKR